MAQKQFVMGNHPAVKSKETRLDDYMANFNPYFWLSDETECISE